MLGNWLTSAEPPLAQQRSQQLLRALQAQAGVHGELLEWLLLPRDTLRQLFVQQTHSSPTPVTVTPPLDIEIDLFGEEEAVAVTPTAPAISPFAERVFADWVNHLRSLPDNAQLLALLNVGKP